MIRKEADYGDARSLLKVLHHPLIGEDQVELRWMRPRGGAAMRRAFYRNVEDAARTAVTLAPTHDVYYGVASRQGNDGTAAGVSRMTALWADLDVKGGRTREDRLTQLDLLCCRPSMLVWSGGGWHPYWLLNRPATGEVDLTRAEAIMRRLAAGLGGDPVWDRSRILRVAGTLNYKREQPRPVRLERCARDIRYTLDRLEEMTGAFPTISGNKLSVGCPPAPPIRKPQLEELGLAPDLSRLSLQVKDLIRLGNQGRYPSRSEADFAVCSAMFRAGYGLAEIWTVMTSPNNGISEKFFDKGDRGEAYLELTIGKALESSRTRNGQRGRPARTYARRTGGYSIG